MSRTGGKGDQQVYAAAQGREFLRNELKGKSNETVREFAGMIDDPETLDLLNYLCSLYRDAGKNFLETRLADIIVRSASTRTIDRAYREGNVSQMQGMVGLTNHDADGDEALTRLAKALTNEGCIELILGPPGAGKTAMTLDISRIWKALTGGTIVSNIESWDGADEHITSSDALREKMAETEGQVLAVIDEAGQSLTSKGAEQSKSDAFAKDLKYVRKKESGDRFAKQGSVLIVGHTRKDTAADIRRLVSIVAEKPSREDPGRVVIYDSDGGKDGLEKESEHKGVTDTAENYGEHEASHFRVDVDDGDDDGDGLDAEQIEKDKDTKTAIQGILKGMNQKEAAGLTDFGRGWVGERWREWKEGEHRDLVEVPATLPEHVAEEEIANA